MLVVIFLGDSKESKSFVGFPVLRRGFIRGPVRSAQSMSLFFLLRFHSSRDSSPQLVHGNMMGEFERSGQLFELSGDT